MPAALWRRAREGDLTERQARESTLRVAADLAEMIVVEVRRSILDLAVELVERRPLRAYDAVQLACAQRLSERGRTAVTFVCADRRLVEAAVAEGLRARHVGG